MAHVRVLRWHRLRILGLLLGSGVAVAACSVFVVPSPGGFAQALPAPILAAIASAGVAAGVALVLFGLSAAAVGFEIISVLGPDRIGVFPTIADAVFRKRRRRAITQVAVKDAALHSRLLPDDPRTREFRIVAPGIDIAFSISDKMVARGWDDRWRQARDSFGD